MKKLQPSLGFLRAIACILGIPTGFWLLRTFGAFVFETWSGGDVGIMIIPIYTLLFGIAYIYVLLTVVFKSAVNNNQFVKRTTLFISTCLVMSLVFLAFAHKLYRIPILRVTNAPLTIFDQYTLEKKLGFRPLIPKQSFPGLEPDWLEVSYGELEFNFRYGSGTVSINQSNSESTSAVMEWCNEMQQDSEHFDSIPLVIAEQDALLYYPKSIETDKWSSYCVPLNDRVIYISPGYGRSVDIQSLKFWLQNLE